MAHEVMNHDRPERPKTAPATPPPAAGRPTQAALPVGVRDGDVLVVGAAEAMSDEECAISADRLRDALGLHVRVVWLPTPTPFTVLRPER